MDLLPTHGGRASEAGFTEPECRPAPAEAAAAPPIVFPPRLSESSRVPLPKIQQQRRLYVLILCLVLSAGTFLRLPAALFEKAAPLAALSAVHPNPGFTGTGF